MFGASTNISTSYTFTQAESYTSADQSANGTSQSVGSTNASAKTNTKISTSNTNKYAKNNVKSDINTDSKTDDNSDQTLIKHQNNEDDESSELLFGQDSEFIPASFAELAAMVGGSENRVTKDQLMAYLHSMKSPTGAATSAAAITVVKNLIAQFDDLSGGSGYLTSLQGTKDPQDYKTITADQVTSPVDVRI